VWIDLDNTKWLRGYRTRLDDASDRTTWAYDARGRVVSETKHISGARAGYTTSRAQWKPRAASARWVTTAYNLLHHLGVKLAAELTKQTDSRMIAA